jgi:hypothetical protein
MVHKHIVALGVIVVILVGLPFLVNKGKGWYQSDYINPTTPPGTTYVGTELPVPPVQAPVAYDLKMTSPRAGDQYFTFSRPDKRVLRVAWEYPTHFAGRSMSFELALIPLAGGEALIIKQPDLPSFVTITPPLSGEYAWQIPSEVPPGNYWVRLYLHDSRTYNGYAVFSEPIVVLE